MPLEWIAALISVACAVVSGYLCFTTFRDTRSHDHDT